MRLVPLYTVTFTTPEAWSVEVAADAGIEGRSFLLAEERSCPNSAECLRPTTPATLAKRPHLRGRRRGQPA
jgi:hypothetical protein